jgi:hypothetical protein
MAAQAETSELAPILKERLHEPKSVFTPGHRLRMNIVPIFLNVFVPWGIFIVAMGVAGFYVMYTRPFLGYAMFAFFVLLWVGTVFLAINRRKYDPEPAWYTFFSIMVGLAVFGGFFLGKSAIYDAYEFPYYQVKDLKVLSDIDASKEHGQNVMDAGMFYFAEGNKIDALRGWHFKQKTVYCVAPIVKGPYPSLPQTQSFDFWAVGKDCCSVAASDFRCGAYNNPAARGGIRNVRDGDRAFYRLAVEQASALYQISANNPVFFEWSDDPLAVVNSWNDRGFRRYLAYCAFALVFFTFFVAMMSAKYSWMGRAESVYGEEIHNDPEWTKGGVQKHLDLHTHERRV